MVTLLSLEEDSTVAPKGITIPLEFTSTQLESQSLRPLDPRPYPHVFRGFAATLLSSAARMAGELAGLRMPAVSSGT